MARSETFHAITKKIKQNEIRDLLSISSMLCLNQRIIYTSTSIYYKYRNMYDDFSPILLYSASIGLASKLCDEPLKYRDLVQHICTYFNVQFDDEHHLEPSINLECQICVESMFEIDCGDPYWYLTKYTKKLEMSPISIERAIIFLNDTVYFPYSIVYRTKKIVEACVKLSILFDDFDGKLDVEQMNEDVYFIMSQIVDFYWLYY